MDTPSEVLNELTHRMDLLEERISRLEHPLTTVAPASAESALPSPPQAEIHPASLAETASIFAVLGKAMLGIAGAYILRAIAESGSLPRPLIAITSILYASSWLGAAARTRIESSFARAAYSATSALILAPMVWELTLRFGVLNAWSAVGVILSFLVAASVIAWSKKLTSPFAMAELGVCAVALALLIGTKNMLPFVSALLIAAAFNELAAVRGRWLRLRFIPAFAADFGIWLLLSVYSRSTRDSGDYPLLSNSELLLPACTLMLIYIASTGLRSVVLLQRVTVFEITQSLAAFLLAATSILHFASPSGTEAFAFSCIGVAIVCYALVSGRHPSMHDTRNTLVYASWALGLFLFGSFLGMSSFWIAVTLSSTALVLTYLADRGPQLALAYHGLIFLLGAAFAAAVVPSALHAVAGDFQGMPSLTGWYICGAAILSYFIAQRLRSETWVWNCFSFCSASLAAWAITIGIVSAMLHVAGIFVPPTVWHTAVIRTLAGSLVALGLAYSGPHLKRPELGWLAYVALGGLTLKLLFEDLRHGHAEFIAASILLYGSVLMLVPRMARRPQTQLTPADGSE